MRVTFRLDIVDRYAGATRLVLLAIPATLFLAVVGLPPVDLHGPLHRMGIMDPLCGGTRAAFLLARGQLGESLRYNPGVTVLAAATAAILLRDSVGRLTGRWVSLVLGRRRVLLAAATAITALEINQQLHAALLSAAWPGR